jgi:hypothetical protein
MIAPVIFNCFVKLSALFIVGLKQLSLSTVYCANHFSLFILFFVFLFLCYFLSILYVFYFPPGLTGIIVCVRRSCDVLQAVLDSVPSSTTLYLWAASMYQNCRPHVMTEAMLTEALRTPPSITREVEKADSIRQQAVPSYSKVPSPLAAEGRAPRFFEHSGANHTANHIMDCEACGEYVADWLRSLYAGQGGIYCAHLKTTIILSLH